MLAVSSFLWFLAGVALVDRLLSDRRQRRALDGKGGAP
jgi:hypothetical protein